MVLLYIKILHLEKLRAFEIMVYAEEILFDESYICSSKFPIFTSVNTLFWTFLDIFDLVYSLHERYFMGDPYLNISSCTAWKL